MSTATEPIKPDYLNADISEDRTMVKLIVVTEQPYPHSRAVVYLDQQAALTLAGQIQYHALMIQKP